ncbi:unnamed protein product [Callosobruchus maculatus]|uniref:SRR1-like domain-containing protein n=1 Tax=Callosobruchus maculatus TaxID=64391 RepID=A0A653D3R9_CALMS|nr:unnamed protein product [Callosobruchus maculatus]
MSNQISEDFKIVAHKKKNSKIKQLHVRQSPEESIVTSITDKEKQQKRIVDAKSEISTSDFQESILASLQEALTALDRPKLSKIVCFGLGKFTDNLSARYQLALLLCLKDFYQVSVCAYDPCFSENEIDLLRHFEIIVLEENMEGKYKVEPGEYVLFYLPHCSRQLSNNLLWSNWGLSLCQCIIIANSFHEIIERSTVKTLKENAEYVSKIMPYVLEVAVINSFKFYEVFNDTAVHVFPKLPFVPPDLWLQNKEPKYSENDIECVTTGVSNLRMKNNVSYEQGLF